MRGKNISQQNLHFEREHENLCPAVKVHPPLIKYLSVSPRSISPPLRLYKS